MVSYITSTKKIRKLLSDGTHVIRRFAHTATYPTGACSITMYWELVPIEEANNFDYYEGKRIRVPVLVDIPKSDLVQFDMGLYRLNKGAE